MHRIHVNMCLPCGYLFFLFTLHKGIANLFGDREKGPDFVSIRMFS